MSNTICNDYEDQVGVIVAVGSNPNDLNNALSFPYPQVQPSARLKGEGCRSCVHGTYCPALYWFKRNIERSPNDHTGISCASWSNDPLDRVTTINDFDRAENARRSCEGILREANPSGITTPTTGSNR